MKQKEEILQMQDVEFIDVDCPEWGTSLKVASMTIEDREIWHAEMSRSDAPGYTTALLVQMTACDASGVRLFSRTDLPALARKSAVVMDRLGSAALKVSKLVPGAVESTAKN